MPSLTISAVAQEVGLRASAIRYYEEIGLLPRPQRMSGQRRYDATVLYRLSVIQRARQVGFTLDEIKCLFVGFESGARASERWLNLSRNKLAELDKQMDEVVAMQNLLKIMMSKCNCDTLEQCGKAIFERGTAKPLRASRRPNQGLPLCAFIHAKRAAL